MVAKHTYEHFRFLAWEWDVAKAFKAVGDDPTLVEFKVGPTFNAYGNLVHVHEEHALSDEVDTNIPVLIVPIPVAKNADGTIVYDPLMIDGFHRLYKANANGIDTMKAIMLTPEQERLCRVAGKSKFDPKSTRRGKQDVSIKLRDAKVATKA